LAGRAIGTAGDGNRHTPQPIQRQQQRPAARQTNETVNVIKGSIPKIVLSATQSSFPRFPKKVFTIFWPSVSAVFR
jgi:hypothetical protein